MRNATDRSIRTDRSEIRQRNRYQQTTIGGTTSRPLAVTSGVPQGSILGPLLFLLHENHLSESVGNSSIATFADDTKIFKTVNNVSDATNFKENSSKANLILNTQKCKVMRITRKHHKTEYPYKLHDAVLESAVHERDLGVWTSSNLTWSNVLKQPKCSAT
ncbi:Hypothetical predicted protein [Paramuricea clavata]|uniref:Uncharacterized protein n=1 Tax=Paramuricea clavata TaxID=317549 RepID=A0A6S7HSY6_PARCT|nr:Hypothetical predicted protein [Paramuricea clavata]